MMGHRDGAIITVGSFDGVHLGHRAVIAEIAARARTRGLQSTLVTFDPHPLEVVNSAAAPPLLTPGVERAVALADTAIDRVHVLRFDQALAALSPDAFVRQILVGRLHLRELVIGHDHGFGRNRSGDADTLRRLGQELGFGVDVVDAVDAASQHVSSSRIRRAIAGGDLTLARELLGRAYAVDGRVVHGAGRGARLGAATVNLGELSPRKLLPPDGVYAVQVQTPAGVFGGMMNQGGRPTFGDASRVLEVHLFGFDGSLYGQVVRVEWVTWLRSVMQFDGPDALQQQVARDRVSAIAALSAVGIEYR